MHGLSSSRLAPVDTPCTDAEKALSSLKARAAMLGLAVYPLATDDGSTAFLIVRSTLSKEVDDLDGVAAFLDRWEGRR